MRMVAILKNDDHPEYGEVSMPLPIKSSEYGHCMELLSSLGIGDALNKDCKVEELTRAYPTLRCLEGCKVNIDELDYLAKRLDGFDAVEMSQFQAMADKLKLTDMKDLINYCPVCVPFHPRGRFQYPGFSPQGGMLFALAATVL